MRGVFRSLTMPADSGELVEVKVSVAPSVVEAIEELAKLQGIAPADALVRAIGRDQLLVRNVKGGGKALIEDPAKKLFEVEVDVLP